MTYEQEIFFGRLNALNSAYRASLRREAGTMLRQAKGTAITVFYHCLPPMENYWLEDRWFAVACMRCMWDEGPEGGKPIESVIAELIKSGDLSNSTKHRIELLLDTEWDADGYMLTKLVRLIKMIRQKSDRTLIDFAALLDDLIRWNSDSQIVQRKWARTIFSVPTGIDNNNTKEKENE